MIILSDVHQDKRFLNAGILVLVFQTLLLSLVDIIDIKDICSNWHKAVYLSQPFLVEKHSSTVH